MSAATPTAPATDVVNIEIDGVPMQAPKGSMIIQAADNAGIAIPRFCYHKKLPIAANCRMCLVEVEKAPKPLPACATPVAEGMKIFTRSPNAIAAQKATMEFLLINHPLDCPICDQGGECELQDLAMGFGRDISRYTERKRVVKDKDIGPLISTDMTRCIHCTRCVRFGQDVAGIQELGTTGRGENTEIGTFVERSVDHELSGNIIDLCPVGALNSKPFRYHARSWEMTQHPLVSPHDGTGTNLYAHVLRGKVMRVVPRPNEAINETWIADRDRFSYEGIYAEDRLATPMIRDGGVWKAVGACPAVARRLARGARQPVRQRRRGLPAGEAVARSRQSEHRPPAAPRGFPRRRPRPAGAVARPRDSRRRVAVLAAADRQQPACGGAVAGASPAQGGDAPRHARGAAESGRFPLPLPGRVTPGRLARADAG
jgi:NADH-quinone oxidoreductase subunit G